MDGSGAETPESASAARASLEAMLDPDVSIAVWGVDVSTAELHAEEAASVRRAVESRRTEFARGRSCARAALLGAGGPSVPIPVGPDREPVFPDGFVGSITHCGTFVAATVARSSVVAGLGVDAERVQYMEEDVRELILGEHDRPDLRGGDPEDAAVIEGTTLLFSAKEALFKAVYPRTRIWMDFQDVGLVVSPSGFSVGWASEAVDGPELRRTEGRWRRAGSLVLTACWVPAG